MNKSNRFKGILVVVITSSMFAACTSKPQVKDDGTLSTVSINGRALTVCDISKVKDTLEIPLSEWVEDFQIVRFEDKDTAFFKMWWPAITDKHIGIRQHGGAFKLFDRQGKFLCDIGGVGQGPGEYRSLYSELIDEKNKCIYLAPFFGSDKILKYGMDGKFDTGLEVGEKMNKPKLTLNEDGSLSVVHLCFKESSKMLAAHIDKDGTVTRYLPSANEGVSSMDNEGAFVGFNHEIWSYNNVSEPSYKYTYADTLYHYDWKNNQTEACFATVNGPKDSFKIYIELPDKYVVIIFGSGTLVADTRAKSSEFVKLRNDFVGGIEAPVNFSNGYFFAVYEPLQLMDRIESRLAESDCTEKDKKVLNELLRSLDEDDNNIMFIGKLKKD